MSSGHNAPSIADPLPDVATSRLDLRRFQLTDLGELAEVFSQPEVWQFPYGRGLTYTETEAFLDAQLQEWDTCGFGCWVARELSTGSMVGYVGLSVPMFLPEILPAVEVGWRFSPSAWGLGYATEGATAALDQAFWTLQLDRVCSVPQSDNPASVRVAERLGMKLIREVDIPANARRGTLRASLFEIERHEWGGQ
ncbi:MAG TPA: GNAT family N-acetyltransferase [Acidimicrobiales bacterium]|nr:GNAT family N-acetyltransferase [Acidimicrobiales bacterium]